MSGADDIDQAGLPLAAGAVAGSSALEATAASDATSPSAAISGDAAIAEALAAGRIDAAKASELLLAEVVAEQIAGANPDSLERVRSTLRDLLDDDPTLARLLAR